MPLRDKPQPGMRPGQHEEQERLLKQLLQGQKQLIKAVGEGGGKPIDINFSWPMDHELMQKVNELLVIVKDIQERLKGGSGLTEAEEQELAAKLSAEKDALKGAVEGNQP